MSTYWRKLSSQLLASSVWGLPHATRIVWITMLAMSDQQGRVQASVPGLARIACVSLDECEKALRTLLAPDKHDRSGVDGGRRLREIDGGWQLTNFDRYQQLQKAEASRARKREWWTENRGVYPPGFEAAWKEYPHYEGRRNKRAAADVWRKRGLEEHAAQVTAWITALRDSDDWTREGGSRVPALEVWLKRPDFSEPPPKAKRRAAPGERERRLGKATKRVEECVRCGHADADHDFATHSDPNHNPCRKCACATWNPAY